MSPAFDHPLWLAALLLVLPALAVALRRADRQRRRNVERFGDPHLLVRSAALPSRRARRAAHGLLLLAAALLCVALARPRSGGGEQTLHRQSHDVLFVLDVSRSMLARDATPSRLAAAQAAALAIARALPDDRVGLVLFGGNAFLQLPLTLDHSTFTRFVEQASMDAVPDPSTNLEAAAELAAEALTRAGGTGARTAIFLTDGEDVEGKLERAIGALRGARVRGYAVGVGSAAGAPIPERNAAGAEVLHKDALGNVVITRLEERNLRDMARRSGGVYAHWDGPASIQPLVSDIARLATGAATSNARAATPDRYQWPLALVIVLLAAESLLALPRRVPRSQAPASRGARRASAAAVLLVLALLGMQSGSSPEALYRSGHFREAYEAFRRLLGALGPGGATEERAILSYDAGNALYRMGRFQDAMTDYRLATAGSNAVRERASFNLGNAYMKFAAGQTDRRPGLHAAITAYEDALVLDPHDADAKWNLELAVRTLAMEYDRYGTGRTNKAEGGGGNLTKAGYAGQPQTGAGASPGGGFGASQSGESMQKITESDARRMLDAIQKAQVMSQASRPISGERSTPARKDW